MKMQLLMYLVFTSGGFAILYVIYMSSFAQITKSPIVKNRSRVVIKEELRYALRWYFVVPFVPFLNIMIIIIWAIIDDWVVEEITKNVLDDFAVAEAVRKIPDK